MWFYCKTADNPADLLTRGDLYLKLKRESFWWEGPEFLSTNSRLFETQETFDDESELLELKSCVNMIQAEENAISNIVDLHKYSSLNRLYKTTAWMFRFIDNLKKKVSKEAIELSPFLKASELQKCEKLWIRENQKSFEKDKIQMLSKQLNLIVDKNKLYRTKNLRMLLYHMKLNF